MKYWAFLSYSHQDNLETRRDGGAGHIRWAEWLHDSLETYRVPAEFRMRQTRTGEQMPERFYPVFQDEKELPINADLGESIRTALRDSRFLIVICSPRSATSLYVNEEVRYFKELGRQNHIMTLIIDGEPNATFKKPDFSDGEECFCPALRHPLNANYQIDTSQRIRQEPIAGDVRIKGSATTHEALRKDLPNHRVALEYTKLKLLAGLMGAGFDELVQRDKERQLREERAKARRLRRLVAGFATLALIAAVAGIIAFVKRREAIQSRNDATRSRDEALHARDQATRSRDEARATLSRSDFLQALRSIDEGKDSNAMAQLVRSLSSNRSNEAALCRLITLLTYRDFALPVATLKHSAPVISALFSPDGEWIMTATKREVRIWDPLTGKPVTEPMKSDDDIYSARFSPDGKRIVTASGWVEVKTHLAADGQEVEERATSRGEVRIWDAQTAQLIGAPIKHDGEVFSAEFSPDGKRIVTGSGDGTARIWDAQTGEPITNAMKHEHGENVFSAEFSPDGRRIVTASSDTTARVWDTQTGKPMTNSMKHDEWVTSARFSPDGKRIVTASEHAVRIWDAQTGKPLIPPIPHDSKLFSAEFSPDGKWIVSVWGEARVWDAQTGKAVSEPMKHDSDGYVSSAQFSADGTRIVTASSDNTARIWDAQTGKAQSEPMKHLGPVNSAQFSPDGKRVLTAADDNTARVWDTQPGAALPEPMGHNSIVTSAQFSSDGKKLVTASADQTARLWDSQTGKPLSEPMEHDAAVDSAQFSSDTQRIVTTAGDSARIWNAQTAEPITEPIKLGGSVHSAKFNPDGKRIVTAMGWSTGRDDMEQPDGTFIKSPHSSGGEARVWDAQTGKSLAEPMKHKDAVLSAEFSPDSKWIVTASEDKTARIWDAQTGIPTVEPMQHQDPVLSAKFSRNCEWVATVAQDDAARLWDAHTGKPLTARMKPETFVEKDYSQKPLPAEFSPDGNRLLTVSQGTAHVWDVKTGKLSMDIVKQKDVTSAHFSPDGKRILTSSTGGVRMWDAQSGDPLTDPFEYRASPYNNIVHSAEFSPDGNQIIAAWGWGANSVRLPREDAQALSGPLYGGAACIWDVSPSGKNSPDWLLRLADFIAQQHLDDRGTFKSPDKDAAAAISEIKQLLSNEPADEELAVFGRWFLADRSSRGISPRSKMTVPEYIEIRIKENTAESLTAAERLAVGNGELLQRIHKARAALK